MGIKVAKDVCIACGNEAPTTADYCEEHECFDKKGVQRFGCKRGLTKTADDGFVQYVDNPSGTFTDISRVGTPADRTAYGALAKYAASVNEMMGGAELALSRGAVEMNESLTKVAELQIYSDALSKLAAIEQAIRLAPEVVAQSNAFRQFDELHSQIIKYAAITGEKEKCATLMHLADFQIVLSPKQFAKYAGFDVSPAYSDAVCGLFHQIDLAADSRWPVLSECSKYACSKKTGLPPHYSLYKLANFYTREGEVDRICAGVLCDTPRTKSASASTAVDYKAAIEYCLYKLAAMTRLNDDIHYVTACIQNL
jgi:hypothetical protein